MPDLDLGDGLAGLASRAESTAQFAPASELRDRGDRMRRSQRRRVVTSAALGIVLLATAGTAFGLRELPSGTPPAASSRSISPSGSAGGTADPAVVRPDAWLQPDELPAAPGERWTASRAPQPDDVDAEPLGFGYPCETAEVRAQWGKLPYQWQAAVASTGRVATQFTVFLPGEAAAGKVVERLTSDLRNCVGKSGAQAGASIDERAGSGTGWAHLPTWQPGDDRPVQIYFARAGTAISVLRILGAPLPAADAGYQRTSDVLATRTAGYGSAASDLPDGPRIAPIVFLQPPELARYGSETWSTRASQAEPVDVAANLPPCTPSALPEVAARNLQSYDSSRSGPSQFQLVLSTKDAAGAAILYRRINDALAGCAAAHPGAGIATSRTAVHENGVAWTYQAGRPVDGYNFLDVHVFMTAARSTVSILILRTPGAAPPYDTGQDDRVLTALESRACGEDAC